MQTKSSYRLLKWTLLSCVVASLATACVVTSGDGTGDNTVGGEGGSTATAGTKAVTGGSSTAGTTTATGGGGTTATAGTTATGGQPEAGAPAGVYVPGACDADNATPSSEPSCDPAANDVGQDCKKCLKAKCCDTWKACYGDTPTIACGYGAKDNDPGQFDCIQNCFMDGAAAATGTANMLLSDCADMCTNQCDNADGGNVMMATSDLITCANDAATCQAACFPFN